MPAANPASARRPLLDLTKKEEMLAVAIRHPDAYAAVHDQLTVKTMARVADPLALVWRTCREFVTKYDALPARGQLEAEIQTALVDNPTMLDDTEVAELHEFLDYAWNDEAHGADISTSATHVRVAVDTCRLLLQEHLAADAHAKLVADGNLPIDLPAALTELQAKSDRIETLSGVDIPLAFPEGWDRRGAGRQKFTCGLSILDEFMGGGWRPGDVTLFLGPFGSCKTVCATHATCGLVRECARLEARDEARLGPGNRPLRPVTVLIFTESDADEYRDRLLSNEARVPWPRLDQMQSIDSLGKARTPGVWSAAVDDPEDPRFAVCRYEETEFATEIGNDLPWKNERERVRAATTLMNRHLVLLDCTESPNSPHRVGKGGIPEVAAVLRSYFDKNPDCYPIGVWLDHLSGLFDRMIDDLPDKNLRVQALTNMPRQVQDLIGKPLKVPVGLFHQFSGAANTKRSPVARFHHAEAEGSKSIAKYATFAFTTAVTNADGMTRWECTKHRRTPPTQFRIVEVQGRFNRLVDRSETHTVDPAGISIMARAELTAYQATRAVRDRFNATDV